MILVTGTAPLLLSILLGSGLCFAGFCPIFVSGRAAGGLGVRARGQRVVRVLGAVPGWDERGRARLQRPACRNLPAFPSVGKTTGTGKDPGAGDGRGKAANRRITE